MGLYSYHGSLVGIQNNLGLPRVAQFRLSADGSHVVSGKVLEYRSAEVEPPTTGAIDSSDFYFMANTQIDNWKDDKFIDVKKNRACPSCSHSIRLRILAQFWATGALSVAIGLDGG